MDAERLRVQDDLRGIVDGDVLCDPLSTQLYASDASIYQVVPLGVIRPRSVGDVVATIQYAAENELSIHPRGAGSGVAGESLGRGLMLDFSRYLRRITTHDEGGLVTVQSGTVLADLNHALAAHRRWYGPDPATRSVTTMGSVLSTNASGSHYLRSGSARDTVESVRVVTADGSLLKLARHEVDDPEDPANRFARGLCEIRKRFLPKIDVSAPASEARGGYRLDDIVAEDGRVELAKFWSGTQGTLAVMVDATVRTETIPPHRGIAVCFFRRLDAAARAAVKVLEHGVVACELMDRRLLQIARDTEDRFASVVPREAESMVLVEIQGASLQELKHRLSVIRQGLSRGRDPAFECLATTKQSERDMFWALCRRVIPRQYRVRSNNKPVPFTEDLSVPPEDLPSLITAVQATLQQNQATATMYAHAGHGQLHVRPFLDLADPEDRQRLRALSQQIAEAVWSHGGQVSVEHAAGLSRSYLMPRQFRDLWPALGQVKRLFDPQNRFNPGKLFGSTLPQPDEDLRPADQTIEIASDNRTLIEAELPVVQAAMAEGRSVPQLEVLQHWPGNATASQVTRACNGCAKCRARAGDERQCPMFRAMHHEEASPRAKANLLRGVLSGQIPVDSLADDRSKEIADLCFNCHQCRVDCPASVDIPKIVGELKAQYVATNGLPVSDQLLGRIDVIAAVGSRFPWLANLLIRDPISRWLAERLFGLSAARDLPPVARETFLRYASKRRWTKASGHGGLKVAYFVDHYANFHDPMIGRALAEILQHNRIGLYVPPGQVTSGMPRISAGDLKGARKVARRNVRLLADVVRQGYTVLATEPAAALCLKHEYPNLLDDEDAHLVAEHSQEACAYLWELHREDRLETDFQPVPARLAYHQPCHLRALYGERTGSKLMALIPELNVDGVEAGCTGMAGTWGLQKKNYRNSLRIGWPLISAMRSAPGTQSATECSACKMQIEHGAGRSTLHPLKLLAYAYGRMPKIESELLRLS